MDFSDFFTTFKFLSTDYDASGEGSGGDLFTDDFISEQIALEGENTYDLIDNQEAYNASGNWSVYDNLSDHIVNKESQSDTEMKEGNFKLHTFYTKFQFI